MPDNATDHSMAKYRFSKAAADERIGIAVLGDEHFGIDRSNRYRDQLKQRFSVLAAARLQVQRVRGAFDRLPNR